MSTRSPAIMTNGADAVAQVAAALIANDKTRLPNDATADPVAAVLAAKARDRLAKDRAVTTEKIAKALQTIDTIKLAPAHDVVHRAVRASLHADAVKAASATEHHEKITAERGARLARKSYEDEHPNAARYRAWAPTAEPGIHNAVALAQRESIVLLI